MSTFPPTPDAPTVWGLTIDARRVDTVIASAFIDLCIVTAANAARIDCKDALAPTDVTIALPFAAFLPPCRMSQ